MAWLSSNTDYIVTSEKCYPLRIVVWEGGTGTAKIASITTTTKYAGCMTKSGAESAKTAYLSAHPTADVQVERENDSGSYRIVISEETRGVWGDET